MNGAGDLISCAGANGEPERKAANRRVKKRYWIAGASGLAGTALAVKLLTRPRDVEWAEHAGRLHHADKSCFVEIEGVRVHYLEAGRPQAPALVLIHGFCTSTFVWREVIVPLAEAGFRVVAPDLLGFGFSAKPADGEYTIEAQARLIVGLLDALGVGRASLVGSSYGGAVAAVCALDFPARVERLVLVGAVANDDILRRPLVALASKPLLGELFTPLVLDARQIMKRRVLRAYARRQGVAFDKARVLAHQRHLKAADTHRAALRMLRRWRASRVEQEAQRLRQPVLLVWGERDEDVPLSAGERLHALIPRSRLLVFRGAGHLPQEERPREFVEVVTEFCRGAGVRHENENLAAD